MSDPVPEQWDMAKPLVYGAVGAMGLMMIFVFGIAVYQTVAGDGPTTEVWASVTGIIGFVTGMVASTYSFRFGTNRSSAVKDKTINDLARPRAARKSRAQERPQ